MVKLEQQVNFGSAIVQMNVPASLTRHPKWKTDPKSSLLSPALKESRLQEGCLILLHVLAWTGVIVSAFMGWKMGGGCSLDDATNVGNVVYNMQMATAITTLVMLVLILVHAAAVHADEVEKLSLAYLFTGLIFCIALFSVMSSTLVFIATTLKFVYCDTTFSDHSLQYVQFISAVCGFSIFLTNAMLYFKQPELSVPQGESPGKPQLVAAAEEGSVKM